MTWVIIAAGLLVVGCITSWRARRNGEGARTALSRNGPPGTLRWWLALVGLALVFVAVAASRFTDSLWWLLLAAPSLALGLYSRNRYGPPADPTDAAGA